METETKIDLLELLPKNFLQIIKEHIFEYNLYPYQLADLLVELEDILFGHGNSLTRERARQTGKTASITILTLSCMTLFPALAQSEKYLKLFPSLHLFKDGFSIVIVAPKIDQAKITLRRLKGISQKKNYKKLMAELGIEVINKSLFLF